LRQCEDSYFKNRNRPCLQYQIQRCTAPCVGLVDEQNYAQDVERALMFLEGQSDKVIDSLTTSMDKASAELAFERAAHYRDQIDRLQKLQTEQYVANQKGDFDIIACAAVGNVGCVQVFFVRNGRHLGNKEFFPAHVQGSSAQEILEAFIPQFYLAGTHDRDIPSNILVSETLADPDWLNDALSEKLGSKVEIKSNPRGDRSKWLQMAAHNADIAVQQRLASNSDQLKRMQSLQDELGLPEMPRRMECFDISHTQGESTVASCVVFDENGPRKSDYRRFNIKDVTAGDDYAAMEQALMRRYTRIKKEDAQFPDILFIDGGKGQVGKALAVLEELQINDILVVGVAKGTTRKPGLETLILARQGKEMVLHKDTAGLLLIQHIRDEAHRFAIAAHRQARSKSRNTSPLEKIPGVGAKRRQQLVRYFGGLQGVLRAGVDDLRRAPGISRELAQKIYDELHSHG
ncbi:MAG: excinuclease ABC subunit UvrC, partial [Pseudomonadota bacterium]